MIVVVTSPRVPPGLLTLAAWDALRAADSISCIDLSDPTAAAVRAAGLTVTADPAGPMDEHADPTSVWLAPVGDLEWAREVAEQLVDGSEGGSTTEVLFASYDLPGARLLDLVAVMDRLRTECPWTRQQTHESLAPYLLEETYEVIDTLDRRDYEQLREELGDLLMQVVFHAAVAQEQDDWAIDDVAESIVEKLIYRNPHVFGDVEVSGPDEVDANWQALKAVEKGRTSVLDGIPSTLPALAYADKVVGRLERDGVVPDLQTDELGDRLLALVREARAAGIDPEAALRVAVARLTASS